MANRKYTERVAGDCVCKPPIVCSVLSNKFWCGKCGKNLKSLSREQLDFVHGCKNPDEVILKTLEMAGV